MAGFVKAAQPGNRIERNILLWGRPSGGTEKVLACARAGFPASFALKVACLNWRVKGTDRAGQETMGKGKAQRRVYRGDRKRVYFAFA